MAAYASASSISYTVKPELDPLQREKLEVERRRQRFEDRRQRILHAKTRIIGIDVEALNDQIAEKQEREKLELERNLFFDEQTLDHSRSISLALAAKRNEERRAAEAMNMFRRQQIAEKQARERVNELSKYSNMGIIGSGDEANTFLNFTGEDTGSKQRTKLQQAQQQAWLNEQLSQAANKEAKERQDLADYAAYQKTINEALNSAAEEKERLKREEAAKLAEYNKQLAREKDNALRRHKVSNQAKDDQEIASSLSSSLLLEDVPPSALGPNRTIPYNFKGFASRQRQDIIDEQAYQQKLLREKREKEALEEKDFANQQEAIRRQLLLQDRAKANKDKQVAHALKDERIIQAKQKSLRTHYLNNVVYTNPVTDEYFTQFGTSCR